ncbi:MAG: alpha/beta hydrolase [Saprospiraceae bacterium]|nr:alpha/beta hydrolase [Saprospiraceae bacterium]
MIVFWLTGFLAILSVGRSIPTATSHYYYYIKGSDPSDFSVKAGVFQYENKALEKMAVEDLSLWKESVKSGIRNLPEGKKAVLFHIHGYMADNPYHVKKSSYVLQKEYFDREDSPYGMVISLQWSAPADYKKSRPVAIEKGKAFAALISELHEYCKDNDLEIQFSFICHSMGNRVLEGVFSGLQDHIACRDIKFGQIFLMAADVENDIFNDRWKYIPDISKEIIIYRNLNDRTLAMANVFVPYKRMGIFGPEDASVCNHQNVILVDVSEMDDDETMAGRLSLHRYYYSSPMVRSKVRMQMSGFKPLFIQTTAK